MWKLISLSALLVVAQAANIHDFYGDWIEVGFFPTSTKNVIACIRFTFDKSSDNEQCVYADGRNATKVKFSITNEAGILVQNISMPMIAVDTAAEVLPALNISCRCGDKEVRDRAVVRFVNDDYFLLYQYVDVGQNVAILFGRKVVSASKLNDVTTNIEDLKNVEAAIVCTTENHSGFKSSDNKVL